jgi:hypothetical protein
MRLTDDIYFDAWLAECQQVYAEERTKNGRSPDYAGFWVDVRVGTYCYWLEYWYRRHYVKLLPDDYAFRNGGGDPSPVKNYTESTMNNRHYR